MTTSLVLLSGMLVAAGLASLIAAFVRHTPRLDAALDRISADGAGPSIHDAGPVTSRSPVCSCNPAEALNIWLLRCTDAVPLLCLMRAISAAAGVARMRAIIPIA